LLLRGQFESVENRTDHAGENYCLLLCDFDKALIEACSDGLGSEVRATISFLSFEFG
jgi:hypothetical protein